MIGTAQLAGLSFNEIKALLAAAPGDEAVIEDVRRSGGRRMPELVATIERATLLKGLARSRPPLPMPKPRRLCLSSKALRRCAPSTVGSLIGKSRSRVVLTKAECEDRHA